MRKKKVEVKEVVEIKEVEQEIQSESNVTYRKELWGSGTNQLVSEALPSVND